MALEDCISHINFVEEEYVVVIPYCNNIYDFIIATPLIVVKTTCYEKQTFTAFTPPKPFETFPVDIFSTTDNKNLLSASTINSYVTSHSRQSLKKNAQTSEQVRSLPSQVPFNLNILLNRKTQLFLFSTRNEGWRFSSIFGATWRFCFGSIKLNRFPAPSAFSMWVSEIWVWLNDASPSRPDCPLFHRSLQSEVWSP